MARAAELTEEELRDIRDSVYGRKSTDSNWYGCRENWIKPEEIQWLLDSLNGETTKPK